MTPTVLYIPTAAPILTRLNYPYTLFVNTDTIGNRRFYGRYSSCRNWRSTGLGDHANHKALATGTWPKHLTRKVEQWRERVRQSLDGRRKTFLKEEFAVPQQCLAYPYWRI